MATSEMNELCVSAIDNILNIPECRLSNNLWKIHEFGNNSNDRIDTNFLIGNRIEYLKIGSNLV
jgi:hypothetical protein